MNPLEKHLGALAADPRFRAIASGDSEGLCLLAVWALDLQLDVEEETRLLYGWIVPSLESAPTRWVGTNPPWRSLEEGKPGRKYRLRRVVLNERPRVLNAVLCALGEGLTLEESSARAGAPRPEGFGTLRLGPADAVMALYAPGAVRFLYRSTYQDLQPSWVRPLRGPSSTSPVFSAPLTRADKTGLFTRKVAVQRQQQESQREPLPGADYLAREALRYLSDETGFDFTGADARRLGDLEWMQPSATDAFENEYISVETVRSQKEDEVTATGVTVAVRVGVLPERARVLVRCRVFHGEEIGEDECRSLAVGDDPLVFPCSPDPTRILVTLWRFEEDGSAKVVYEEDAYLLRQIGIGMGIMGLRGRLETDFTRSLSSARKKIRGRVEKVSALGQVSYQRSYAGSRSRLEEAEREAGELARQLFPQASGARFFPKGWDKEGPGLLAFVEWFRELTDDAEATGFVIMDPYFGQVALEELVARAKGTQASYLVLTNTQIPSLDDEGSASSAAERSRRNSIPEKCEQLRGILSQLNLEILDLRSNGAKTEALFHDRYILVYGPAARLVRGFHLSNSIQGATRNAPLLVTPIPPDVLDSVGEYVAALREADPEVVINASAVTLFSTREWRKPVASRGGEEVFPYRGMLFTSLLGDRSLETRTEEELSAFLQTAKLLDGQRYSVAPEVRRGLGPLLGEMASADEATFEKLWTALSEWEARTSGGEDAVDSALAPAMPALSSRLERFVATAMTRPPPEGTRGVPMSGVASGTMHLCYGAFQDVLDDAEYMDHLARRDYRLDAHAVRLAVGVLGKLSPEGLVRAAERVVQEVPPAERLRTNAPRNVAAAHVMGVVVSQLIECLHANASLIAPAMFRSSLAFLRALAAQHYMQEGSVESLLKELRLLLPHEQLIALAEKVGALRVEANRNDYRETNEVRSARCAVFQAMIVLWPIEMSDAGLTDLVRRVGGPGSGAWAVSTTRDLLVPLASAGKLTPDGILDLWGSQLEAKMQQMLRCGSGAHTFYRRDDGELAEAFALAVANGSAERRSSWLKRLAHVAETARRLLATPFARTREYSTWAGARECIEWMWATFVLVCAQQVNTAGAAAALGEWAKAKESLEPVLERTPASHNPELRGFVEALRQHVVK